MSDRRQPKLADGRRSRGFVSVEVELFDADISGEALALLLRIRRDSDQREADGWIDGRALRALAAFHDIPQKRLDALVQQLVDAGLAEIDGDRVDDLNFLAWNRSAEERDAQREGWASRKRRSRGDDPDASPDPSPTESTEESRRDAQGDSREESTEESRAGSRRASQHSRRYLSQSHSHSQSHTETDVSEASGPERPDVEKLCSAMADSVEARGERRPPVTGAWRKAARLLLDADRRPLQEALDLIAWLTGHEFWRSNVLGLPKFREQYPKLRLQHERESRPATNGRAGPTVAPAPRHQLDSETRAAYAAASRSALPS